jgi:conjugal transfer pilus assembly protein TraE
MNLQGLQKIVRRTRMQRNAILAVGCILLAVNALLGIRLFTQTNQVVLVPTNVSDGMVARGASDKRYIEALALDAVYGLYNASPASLDYGRAVIERIASVSERNNLLRHYDDVATDIRERDISTVFFPRQIEHNIDNLEVVVEGDLQTYLNTVLISVEPRRVLLSFVAEAGSVRLFRVSRLEMES